MVFRSCDWGRQAEAAVMERERERAREIVGDGRWGRRETREELSGILFRSPEGKVWKNGKPQAEEAGLRCQLNCGRPWAVILPL